MKNSKTPYACAICKKEFHGSIPLVKHFELRHRSLNKKTSVSNKIVVINLRNDKQRDSSKKQTNKKCNELDNLSINEKEFESKSKDIKKNDGKVEIDIVDDEKLKTSSNKEKDKIVYKCSYCEKKFKAKCKKQEHDRVHTGEKPYSCKYCNKKFAKCGVKNEHEKIHTGDKPYSCKFCDKKFTQLGHIRRHEMIHTGEKPFGCSFCTRKFITPKAQKIHEMNHTGEKPFSCSYCDKKFITSSQLNCHERTHTGEKPYACSFCEKKFAQITVAKNHMKNMHKKK